MNAISVKSVKADQAKLQKIYDIANVASYKARDTLMSAKIELCAFNDKYGRVIAMMETDKK